MSTANPSPHPGGPESLRSNPGQESEKRIGPEGDQSAALAVVMVAARAAMTMPVLMNL